MHMACFLPWLGFVAISHNASNLAKRAYWLEFGETPASVLFTFEYLLPSSACQEDHIAAITGTETHKYYKECDW